MKKTYSKNIFQLIIVQFITYFYMVQVIQTVYMSKNGLNLVQIGIVYAVYQLSKVLFEVPTGVVADKCGRKISTVSGSVFLIVSNLCAFIFKSYGGFLLAAVFQGISYTLVSGASDALFIDSIYASGKKELFEKYNAIMRFGVYIAIFMSSALGGYIADKSLDLVYQITIVLQFIPIFILILLVVEPPYKKVAAKEMKIRFAVDSILKSKRVLYILLIDVFISVACIPLEAHYFNYFLSIGISEKISGFVYGAQYLVSSLLGLFLYQPIHKYMKEKSIIYLPPLIMVAIFLFALIPGLVAKSFFYFIALLILCGFSPIKANLLHQNLDSTYRASSLSLQSLCMSLLAFVLQPLFGKTAESLGYPLAIEIVSILAFLLLIFNGSRLKKHLDQIS